ncbi:hypothetical protein J2789_003903 [Variovorax paradoxus]|uniref:hypothetical protein n=1 Tax=Variovorax atrisoli TaxID=3394203 RepID=UPI00119BEA82|nr:hypothetical protein [Variovorax paradoxus]MDR6521216.1 hypothetical protein [Variovorax paradoxus]
MIPRWLLSLLLVFALGCQSFAALAKSHDAAMAPVDAAGLHHLSSIHCEAPAGPFTTLEERSPATDLAPDLSEICGLRNATLHHARWHDASPPQDIHAPPSRVLPVPLKPPRTRIAA